MLRRSLLGALAALGSLSPALAATKIRIWGLWVVGPAAYKPNDPGAVKGTMYFRVNTDPYDRSLITYGNGTAASAPDRQCPELIKRYAAKLGFKGFTDSLKADNGNKLPSLGDGHQAAKNFAAKSDGAFVFVPNGSAEMPKPGAVLSIVEFVKGGHVGILCNHSANSNQTSPFSVKLFDQNMPITSWKEVKFTKSNKKWSGKFTNNRKDYDVVGWANPTG